MKHPIKVLWIVTPIIALCALAVFKMVFHVKARAGYFADDKRLATAAVDRFHSEFNAGQYQAIYNEASPTFQSAGSPSSLTATMAKAKAQFGKEIRAVQVGASAFPGGQVRFVYNTQYQKGPTTELFIWQSDGEKASLVRYQIFPGTVKP